MAGERRAAGLKMAAAVAVLLAVAMAAAGCKQRAPRRAVGKPPAAKQDDRFAAGALLYSTYCALCHGVDARGYAADHAPSLISATFLESASDEFITKGIRDGRPGTAMASYGKGRGGPLADDEIAAIVAFLRGLGPARVPLSRAAVQGDPVRGEEVYAATCKGCHGTRKDRGFAVHLGNASFLSAASDPFLRHAIVHGRPETPMPAFEGVIAEADIDDLVAMLRSWGPSREPPRPTTAREPPPLEDVVMNPKGKAPDFTLRSDRFVPIDDVRTAMNDHRRMVIVDARTASDWFAMHIPGSISVPYYAFDRLDALPNDSTWILAYCACPHHASGAVVDELRKRGYKKTAILDEGIPEWNKRGYPIAGEAPPSDAGDAKVPAVKPARVPKLRKPR